MVLSTYQCHATVMAACFVLLLDSNTFWYKCVLMFSYFYLWQVVID